jgi:hypothetical protein
MPPHVREPRRVGAGLASFSGMTSDGDSDLGHEHSVELNNEAELPGAGRRRSFVALIVAAGLALAGVLIVLGVRSQRVNAERRALDAVQREELRDGWQTLSAAAAQQAAVSDALSQAAQQAAAQQAAAASANASPAPAAPAPNIVIVNVPGEAPRSTSSVGAPPPPASNAAPQPTTSASSSVNTLVVPVPVTGAGSTVSAVPGQNLSNSSVPGPVPNPALPNAGLGGTPTPGLPNGNSNVTPATPSLPSATTPVSPPAASPPSGANF